MFIIVPALSKPAARLIALGLAVGLSAGSALADSPHTHQFADAIEDSGVVRHAVPVAEAGTWAISMQSRGDARMFVSTDSSFRPHDAVCAGDATCTITVEKTEGLYVFVLAESSVDYDIVATPARVTAQR